MAKKIETPPISKSSTTWLKWAAKNIPAIGSSMWNKYKKIRTKMRAAKTKNQKKKFNKELQNLEMKVKKAKATSDIKGFGQKVKLNTEKLKQAKIRTKKMKPPGYGTKVLKGTGTALKGTGKALSGTASGARTLGSRVTGFGRRKGDPRRLVRKGLTVGYGISDLSDPLVRGVLGDKTGDKVISAKKKFLGMRGGGKIQYKIDNQGQDLVQKMYGGKVKK